MLPCFSFNNPKNIGMENAEFLSQGADSKTSFTFYIKSPNASYFVFCQLCLRMIFSLITWRVKPTFPGSVLTVFAIRPKKQMTWPNARWVVAFMANAHSFRNLLFMLNHPRSAMGRNIFTPLPIPKSPISLPISRANPKPTSLTFLNFWPESILKGYFPVNARHGFIA